MFKTNPDYQLVHKCLLGDRNAEYELFSKIYKTGKAYIWAKARKIILAQTRKKINQSGKTVDIEMLESNNVIQFIPNANDLANPLVILLKKEEQEELTKAMGKLSDDHKQVLQFYANGMKLTEIAEIADKTKEATYSMFYRAIKSLKQAYESL